MNPSFDVGDEVITSIPVEAVLSASGNDVVDKSILNNPAKFNAGWENEMCRYIGCTGTIIDTNRRPAGLGMSYRLQFENKATWWWDERYLSPITDDATIPRSEFESIF